MCSNYASLPSSLLVPSYTFRESEILYCLYAQCVIEHVVLFNDSLFLICIFQSLFYKITIMNNMDYSLKNDV